MKAVIGHPSYHQLAAYHFEALEPEEMVRIEDHLQTCALCRSFLRSADRDALVELYENPSTGGSTKSPALETLPIPPADTNIPEELRNHPRYEIIKLLGEGGMGMVFRARHKKMNREVAIKIIHGRHVQSEMAIRRFHQEIEALSQLQHPNISQAFDADQVGNIHFFAMEFIEGTDLSKLIKKKGALPVREACFLIKQVAEALQHADEKHMIHRDLKPANLIVMKNGTVKILDFGLARITTTETQKEALTGEGMVMGTPEYMAPEQGRNAKNADIRSDLYSVGVTLYQLLTGRLPFKGTPMECLIAHQMEAPPPITNFQPDLPKELVYIVHRLLEKDPAKRYQKPAELVKDLQPFTGKLKAPGTGGPKTGSIPKPRPATVAPPETRFIDPQQEQRESIIKGEQANALAADEDIVFNWDEPNRPKRKPISQVKGGERTPPPKQPGRGITPMPAADDDYLQPLPPDSPRRPVGVFIDEFKKDEEPSTLKRLKAEEAAATNRIILILVLLALLGGAILYVVLVLIPGSQTKPDKKAEIFRDRELVWVADSLAK